MRKKCYYAKCLEFVLISVINEMKWDVIGLLQQAFQTPLCPNNCVQQMIVGDRNIITYLHAHCVKLEYNIII